MRSPGVRSPVPATKSPGPRTRPPARLTTTGGSTRPIKAGTYTMVARAKGYVWGGYGALDTPFGAPIDVRAGRVSSGIEIRLTASGAINGRILDDRGNGVQGVEIVLEPVRGLADRQQAGLGGVRTDHRERGVSRHSRAGRLLRARLRRRAAARGQRGQSPHLRGHVLPRRAREGRGPAAAHRRCDSISTTSTSRWPRQGSCGCEARWWTRAATAYRRTALPQ